MFDRKKKDVMVLGDLLNDLERSKEIKSRIEGHLKGMDNVSNTLQLEPSPFNISVSTFTSFFSSVLVNRP